MSVLTRTRGEDVLANLLIVTSIPGCARHRFEVGHGQIQDGAALRVRELVGVAWLDLEGHGA